MRNGLIEANRALVRDHGDSVDIKTEKCVAFRKRNINCAGCDSELGCVKAVSLGVLDLSFSVEHMSKDVFEEKMWAIINATTLNELSELRSGFSE
ncbi:MAG: hypothetical protein KAS32_30200 [Candidatus Peribacteraceae bacterium]|nr:hypothetical protein [Candidatus Peribacteraceae bacterium]